MLGALATLGVSLMLTSAANASGSPFTWMGNSSEPDWSIGLNWGNGSAPSISEPVTLEFPRIPNCYGTCYKSENNLSGLTAESIALDNGDEYTLSGNEITLGSGGLTASPASGSSGASGDVLKLPIKLTGSSQTWSVAGRSGGGLGENGLAVLEKVSGSSSNALAFEISNEAVLYLENETEVGPAAISGADTGEAGIFNGYVGYFGDLNFEDGNPVSLNHIFFVGSGALGALSTDAAELDVGSGLDPAEGIVADSATFDSASEVGFQITGEGTTAGKDYSQLSSTGPIELGGSSLIVHGTPPSSKSDICPSPRPGQKYTFVSTTGTLSGTFANAPERGSEIPITFAKSCNHTAQTMRIAYDRSGGTKTVIGTVEEEAATNKQKEEEATKKIQEEEATKRKHEEEVRKEEALKSPPGKFESPTPTPITGNIEATSEEATARAAQERAIREAGERAGQEAAAKKKEEEESSPTGSVLLDGSGLAVQSSGEAVVKLACAGTAKCAGKLTLTVKSAAKKGKKAKTETIGTATFSILPNETTSIKLTLNAAGKALLGTDHGRLGATLSILKSSPIPSQAHTDSVHLVQQKVHGKTKK